MKTNRIVAPLLLFGLSLYLCPTGKSRADEVPDPSDSPDGAHALLDRLESRYSEYATLRAGFRIESINQAIGEVEIEEGVLSATRPDRMRWQYQEPPDKVVLLDGQYQWLYLPFEEQAFRGEQSETSSELTLALLADPGAVARRFEVSLATAEDGEPETVRLLLEPRSDGEDVRRILLGIDEENVQLVSMELVDSFDNVTKIRFFAIELGAPIPDKTYRFNPPRGTEILDFSGEPID